MTAADPAPAPEEQRAAREAGEQVLRLAGRLNDVLAGCTAAEELSVGEARALSYVRERPTTNREIADSLRVDASRATVLIKALEQRGLVRRLESSGDRRRRPVAITDDGEAVVARIGSCLAASSPLLRALDHDELTRLADLLGRVAAVELGSGPQPVGDGSESDGRTVG